VISQASPSRGFLLEWVGVLVVLCSHYQTEFPIAATLVHVDDHRCVLLPHIDQVKRAGRSGIVQLLGNSSHARCVILDWTHSARESFAGSSCSITAFNMPVHELRKYTRRNVSDLEGRSIEIARSHSRKSDQYTSRGLHCMTLAQTIASAAESRPPGESFRVG
jgi:hypothetical protein